MTDAGGVYRHPPGQLSRWGVVDVGLKCPHSCRHCFYSFMPAPGREQGGGGQDQFAGMRHARWHRLENLLALVDSLAESGFLGLDITGGEPTAFPGLVDLVRHAAGRGLAPRVITLGQFLGRRQLLDRLLAAGIVDFRFSLHAVDPAMFAAMTGGELGRLVAAMDALQARGFQYVTNTTVTEANLAALPAIAQWIAARPEIYQANFLCFMPHYQWAAAAHAGDHRVRYSDIGAVLRQAVAIVEAAGIGATIRYAPLCTMAGLERNLVGNVGVRHDPHEWMNAIDHGADPERATPATMRAMGRPLPLADHSAHYPLQASPDRRYLASRAGKVFPLSCRGCGAINVCDGVDRAYLAKFGDGELTRYGEFRGDLLDRERLAYLAGFISKTSAFADARRAVSNSLTPKSVGQ